MSSEYIYIYFYRAEVYTEGTANLLSKHSGTFETKRRIKTQEDYKHIEKQLRGKIKEGYSGEVDVLINYIDYFVRRKKEGVVFKSEDTSLRI